MIRFFYRIIILVALCGYIASFSFAKEPEIRFVIFEKERDTIALYLNEERIKTILVSGKGISGIRFSRTNRDIVYYLYKHDNRYSIIEKNIAANSTKELLISSVRISDFCIHNSGIYYLKNGDIGTDSHELFLFDPESKKRTLLFNVTDKDEWLDELVVSDKYICFIIRNFGRRELNVLDKQTGKVYRYTRPVASIFGNIADDSLLIETVDMKSDMKISREKYDGSLGILHLSSKQYSPLEIKYERPAGNPIRVSDELIILPAERNVLRNRLKSVPFGFRDYDIVYLLYNVSTRSNAGEYFATNTKALTVLDAEMSYR